VYGLLDHRVEPATLHLLFCVRNTNLFKRDMGSLAELQQVDRLGSPLQLHLPIRDVHSSVKPELRVRTALVAKLVVGLRYEFADNPNFQRNLKRALDVFNDARDFLEREAGGPNRDNGGDLVLYFIGREHFFLAQDQATIADHQAEHLDHAQSVFARAISLHPQFARAATALGSVFFVRAQRLAATDHLRHDVLMQAIDA
jgi:hypothetical protein